MDYRITVALTEYGRPEVAEENAERYLEGFLKTHAEAGPAVGADLARGWLEVTFSVEADTYDAAFELGRPIFAEGAAASGLQATEVARIEVEAVEAADDRELVPA